MPAPFDATEFVDTEFEAHKTLGVPAAAPAALAARATGAEEVSQKMLEAQGKIAELKRAQEELERQQAALAETRRRQDEFQRGREEMIIHLTRGVGLLEEAEFAARRDAEQMARTLIEFRDALGKLQAIREEHWKQDQLSAELTRALTTIENARMEWNSARLKFTMLTSETATAPATGQTRAAPATGLTGLGLVELCRLGLALTWPLAAVGLLGLIVLVALWLRGP
jgi:hypothetical protein